MSETAPAPKKPRGPAKPYYRALRTMHVGDRTYKRGQMVPEAKTWPRVEAWVRARHLELVE